MIAHEAYIRELWRDGFSYAEIAFELSTSRNAIAGKIYRLGLTDADRAGKGAKERVKRRQIKDRERCRIYHAKKKGQLACHP